jgi:AraC-like DNA-binding protein
MHRNVVTPMITLQPRPGTTRFSTESVPIKDRSAVAREVLGRAFLRFDLQPLADAPYRGSFEQQNWAWASLLFAETDAVSLARTSELICDGNADFRLSRIEGARVSFSSREGAEELSSGDAALWSNAVPGASRMLARGRILSIRLPHQQLAAAVPRLEGRAIRRMDPASPALRLLDAYTAILRREGPSGNPLLDHHVAQHLIDLTALTLGPSEESRERAASGAVRAARLATIRADVLANLSEVRLSAKTIAKRHGLTDRYVHMLFEETGQTFGRFVEQERLKRAFALLTDPARINIRIGEIATQVGYSEHSAFNRAFRRRFGETPGNLRPRKK